MNTKPNYTSPQAFDLSGLGAYGGKPKPMSSCLAGHTVISKSCSTGATAKDGQGCSTGDYPATGSGTCAPQGSQQDAGTCYNGGTADLPTCRSGTGALLH